jgi:hypothetical protein
LYLGCLVLAVEIGYIEYRFGILRERWDDYLLASAMVYVALAYRFDNRFVLSLALATLGGWFGVRASDRLLFLAEPIRIAVLTYGMVVAAFGFVLYRQGLKRHFLDTYLHVAANAVLGALLSGVLAGRTVSAWSGALTLVAGAVVWTGVRFRRFAFVVYGAFYGYVGISRDLLRGVASIETALAYVVVSASLVVVGLVTLARRFGREA